MNNLHISLCCLLLIGSASAQTHIWEHKADGRLVADCDPSGPGGERYWPDNMFWNQDQHITNHPCPPHNPGYIQEPSNWNVADYPDSPSVSVLVGSGPEIDINGSYTVGSLEVTSGYNLPFHGGSVLKVHQSITNDGTITLQDHGAGIATLSIGDNVGLSGAGQVIFSGPFDNRITSVGVDDVLTIGAGHELVTTTDTDLTTSLILASITNNGTITADVGGLRLQSNPKTNRGLIQAINGGTLGFHSTAVDNPMGTITAGAGSTVDLYASSIAGGTVDGAGDYTLAGASSTFDGSASTLSFAGTLGIGSSGTLVLEGSISNDGLINIADPAVGASRVTIDGDVDLQGSGQVVFNTPNNNELNSVAASDVLTIGASQELTTSSDSSVGVSRVIAAVTNNGTITANQGGLQLDTNPKTNNSLMQASGGGLLRFSDTTVDNSSGTITAGSASTVELKTSTIEGGLLNGQGSFEVSASSGTLDGSTAPLTLASTANIGTSGILVLRGTVHNNGQVNITDLGGGIVYLRLDGNVSLQGTGSVVFASAQNNELDGVNPADTLTIGPDQKVTTSTDSHVDNSLLKVATVNEGAISADGGALRLDTYDKTNNGLMESVNGGLLRFYNIGVDNSTGQITAGAGSSIEIWGTTISGGLLDGDGSFLPIGTSSRLDGSTSTLSFDSTALLGTGDTLTLQGAIHNNGSIQIADQGGGVVYLKLDGDVGLSGSGQVVFASANQNYLEGVSPADTLTIGAGQQVTTTGDSVAVWSRLIAAVTNNGTISADGGGLQLMTNSKTNNGTFRATGGGTLQVTSADAILLNYQSAGNQLNGGTWEALGSSTIDLAGTTINVLGPTTRVVLRGGGSIPQLAMLATIDGTFALQDGHSFSTSGDLEVNGRVEFGLPDSSPGNWDATRIVVNGNIDLDGATIDVLDRGITAGRYRLIDYTGILTGTPVLGTVPGGWNFSLDTSSAGQVDLVVSDASDPPPEIIDISRVPGSTTITYLSRVGVAFEVRGSDDLIDFDDILPDTPVGDGTEKQYFDNQPGRPASYFYQFRNP